MVQPGIEQSIYGGRKKWFPFLLPSSIHVGFSEFLAIRTSNYGCLKKVILFLWQPEYHDHAHYHTLNYLFSDWPKAYSEVSKSVLVRSSSCRLYNNRIWKNLRPHEYVKSPFLKIYNLEKQKHDFYFLFFVQCIIEQLLDSVFVITRIIKVSVRVISPTSIVAPIEKW